MAYKINFRMRVMKYAWHLRKTTRLAWRICMIKAWELYRLSKSMRNGVVSFYYLRSDGTVRKARGTLRNTAVDGNHCKLTKPSYRTMAYIDVDKNAFRCFKIENLICVIG